MERRTALGAHVLFLRYPDAIQLVQLVDGDNHFVASDSYNWWWYYFPHFILVLNLFHVYYFFNWIIILDPFVNLLFFTIIKSNGHLYYFSEYWVS